ncbi:MAG TPA: HlyD family efflux transporter periplasmic adaptor subunit [Chloroflexia bacterium]|nr:HlyD family efflux transporter periplasmic adaptor subunit [Chloroflexia bacterium]
MDEPKDLVPTGEETEKLNLVNGHQVAGPLTEHNGTASADVAHAPEAPGKKKGLATSAGDGSSPLARPLPRSRQPVKKRTRPWGWVFVVLLAIAAGVGTFYYVRSTQTSTVFQGQTVQASTRLPVSVSISTNGQVQANADLGVTFGSSGTLTKLNKKQGDTVKAGDSLAEIDPSNLQFDLQSAQAALDQQQASYNKAIAGATQKDLEVAQAQVDAAKANLDKTINGTATAQDIASANASINSAAAKLAQDRQGGSPQDIAAAQSGISSAEASLASAQAALAKTLAGSDSTAITQAQATYDQAVANYNKTISQLKLSITNAQVNRDQMLNALKTAQDKYNSIYQNNHNADGSLKQNLKQSDIDSETAALRAMQDAQGNYNKADMALNDANTQLSAQTQSLQSSIDSAKAALDKAKQGPTQADIAAAQAQVASAQAGLDKAKQSQAALTPTQAQIAADEASLAAAQASLAKLRGGTPDDIASSNASLRQAQATLDDLKRGPNPNDIAIAKAQLDVAKIKVDTAKAALDNAVLKSPINGTIVSAPLTLGQQVTASTVVYQVVDLSSLHVDVNVGETDISKIKENMPVAVNLDAIPNRSFTGKVTFISSKSTVTNNVVNYLATVTLDQNGTNSLLDAYQGEFDKLQQALRAGNTNNATGQTQGGGQFARGGGAGAQFAAASGICGYNIGNLFRNNANAAAQSSQNDPKVGMTANVTFCESLKAGVLSVPNRAIKTKFENGQRVTYVTVLLDRETGKTEDRPITTGLQGDTYTEVTGGNLKDGDQIVVSTTPTNSTTGGNNRGGGGFNIPGGGGGGGFGGPRGG